MRKLIAAFLLTACPWAVCASLKQSELAAEQVVDQFVQGCFMNFPYPEKFATWLAQPGFQKLSEADASSYLGEYAGQAWSVQLDNSRYVLTTIGSSACNVFSRDVDGAMTEDLVVGFLGYLKTQGATYESKRITPKSALADGVSTSYSVFVEGQVIMNIVLSIAPSSNGASQIALTASKTGT